MRIFLSNLLFFLVFLSISHSSCVASDRRDDELNSSDSLKSIAYGANNNNLEEEIKPALEANTRPGIERNELYNYDNGEAAVILQKIDDDFFKNETKGTKAAGWIGAAVGSLPSSPTCGVLIYSIGDVLRLPPSGSAFSWTMVGWILATTTPAFSEQMARRLKIMHTSVHQKDQYVVSLYDREATERAEDKLKRKKARSQPSLIDLEEQPNTDEKVDKIYKDKPLLIEGSRAYKAGKVLFFLGSAFNALVPCMQMILIEDKHLSLATALSPFFFTAITEHLYRISVDRLKHYIYTDAMLHQRKRNTLLRKVDEFQKRLAMNNSFVARQYKIITGETALTAAKLPSKICAFFIRSEEGRMDVELPGGRALNLINDLDTSGPSPLSRALSTGTDLVMGASLITRYMTTQYMLASLLFWSGVDSDTSFWLSSVLAAAVTMYRCFGEYDIHHKNSQTLLNTFSYNHLGANKRLRKISAFPTLVNAGLFGLIYPVIASQALGDIGAAPKHLLLGAEFLIDFSFFFDFFDTHYSNMITDAAALKPSCRDGKINYKRAYLHTKAQEAKAFIRDATDETINTLYVESRKAL